MPYILTKTNGATLTTINDATLDETTDLGLVGRNYSGYGQIVNENFVKLLENFSNTSPPAKPVTGELWYNSATKQLNVCYDGSNFKSLAGLHVQSSEPTFNQSTTGDLWWNTASQQLFGFNGQAYELVGPSISSVSDAYWINSDQTDKNDVNSVNPVLIAEISSYPVATVSNADLFLPTAASVLNENWSNGIQKGITLAGCDAKGSSAANGYYFWGTAVESLTCNTTTSITVATTTSNGTFYVALSDHTDGSTKLYTSSTGISYSSGVLNTVASSARYADLAERYEADNEYTTGTVLIIGGSKEVTTTNQRASTAVAGVVSENPAYRMNSEAGTDKTHPYIALKGRVLCRVVGNVLKGDLLVTSTRPGYAEVYQTGDSPLAVIGCALSDFIGENGTVEIKV